MRNLFFSISVIAFLVLPCDSATGQEGIRPEQWVSSNLHYGFILAHSRNIRYLTDGHTPGGEVTFSKATSGQKKWHQIYRLPEMGVSLYYIYLSNPSQLGFGISATPFINFPLIKRERFSLKMRTATSVGYISKTFDRVNNFQNGAMSSHFNCFINLRLNAHSMLGKNYRLEYGLGLAHFSNGAFKMPNLGVNITTINIGLARKITGGAGPVVVRDTVLTSIPKSRNEFVVWGGGFKSQVVPPSKINYAAFTVSASFDRTIRSKHRFFLGLELGYNGGNIERLARDSVYVSKKSENLQHGIKAGYALRVDKLEFPLEYGYYLNTLYKKDGPYFHRIGFRYYCSNNLVVNMTLKAHWAVANYWEFGVGYVFRKKIMK